MAISFKQQKISTPDYNLYQINRFNGVDYTTTPVSVDDSRATDISNYLPVGNALIKRNGWEVVNRLLYNGKQIEVFNIFPFNDNFIAYANYYDNNNVKKAGIFLLTTLEETNNNYSITLLKYGDTTSNNYSYGVAFESRLFILCMNDYFMVYTNGSNNIVCEPVSNYAYIPLVLAGLGDKDGQESATQIKRFNMLGNKAKIKITRYQDDISSHTYVYPIAEALGMTNRTITITKIEGEIFTSGNVITGIGTVTWDSEKQRLEIVTTAVQSLDDPDVQTNATLITVEFEYTKETDEANMVKKMRFGIPFGSYGHRDRLFLAGNPDYANMDIHTGETADDEEAQEWWDYTYFPDNSFKKFGTSNNAITGYGILSNGYMAIFMRQILGEANLYVRSYNMDKDSDGNYIEQFPVYTSGISIENREPNQIIKYGNDLLINTSRGIYKMIVGSSTATQTYETVEMSYYIRDNLGTDVNNSCNVVYDGKLFICRTDYTSDTNGRYNTNKRVYVADMDRYSFIDGKQVYEWWVLDGISAVKMFNLKDFSINSNTSSQTESLYFIDNAYGLCKINTKKYDTYTYEPKTVEINEETMSKELFIDTENDKVILDTSSDLLGTIMDKTDVEKYYNHFKNYYKVSFDIPLYAKIDILDDDSELNNGVYTQLNIVLNNSVLIEYAVMNDFNIIYKNKVYTINGLDYSQTPNDNVSVTLTVTETGNSSETIDNDILGIIIPANTMFGIGNLYEKNTNKPLDECYVSSNVWYHLNKTTQDITELGSEFSTYFNKFTLSFNYVELDFEPYGSNTFSKAIFYINNPIESYWYGKHTSLGRVDYLKTVDNITFVPETRNGGYTTVGYRTFKNEVSYFTQAVNQSLNFEDIDFSDFSFGGEAIAQSYTSKKKIKNFSFMQLKLYSNDEKNSTITSIAFRYKYTRKNKGVK